MAGQGMPAVDDFGQLLQEMLDSALEVKQSTTVPLNKSDLPELFARVDSVFPDTLSSDSRKHAIETAARNIFNNLLATTAIESPDFINLWNLLDIVSILSDDDHTEPAVLFWLVEELLDSQTVAGCRKIFDYLESRRERITAKNFAQKNLVILRSCNELLRRLSRAEDTAFCGRVFIFLFQSFPLGDKSSVNLRGEYHTENVTTFDLLSLKETDNESMDVDVQPTIAPPTETNDAARKPTDDTANAAKGVSFSKPEAPMSADDLYPIFWTLQQSFSQPKKLFDQKNLSAFKAGLEATMAMFKSVQTESSGRSTKVAEEGKRGTKRKRGQGDDDLANAFNPKYLTSRDLFELEISDVSFRRHILVQVLIVVDFLMSLSVKAKEKLSKATLPDNVNKSVMYADQVLSAEDTQWAIDIKRSITEYLKQMHEGPFFHRMIESVLTRDKNWVRWKIENCPSIAREAITPQAYVASVAAARRASSKRPRLAPSGAAGTFDLSFLSEGESKGGLDRLKDPERYQVPSIKSFQSKIEFDDMNIDMAMDDASKNVLVEAKASKSWRALRIASATKLAVFDKIERSDKIDVIFQDNVKAEEPVQNGDEDTVDGQERVPPKDRRPIVVSGPSGVGKGTLIRKLLEKHEKSIARKASHTTRPPREKEVDGIDYFFINKEKYDTMRDGDEYLEYNNFNGNDYGTSRKVVEGIIAQGKIPIMEMDYHGVQQLKDQSYDARFIFLMPPSIPELTSRLTSRGTDSEEKIQERLKIAEEEIEKSKVESFHDKIIINDDLDTAFKELESYIFGVGEEKNEATTEGGEQVTPEVTMLEVEMVGEEGSAKEEAPATNDTPLPEEATGGDASIAEVAETAALADPPKANGEMA